MYISVFFKCKIVSLMLRDFLSSREYTTRRNGGLPRFVVEFRENVSSSLSVSLPSSRIQHFCVVITTILRFEIIFSVLCGTLSVLLSKCLFLFFFESSNVSRFSFVGRFNLQHYLLRPEDTRVPFISIDYPCCFALSMRVDTHICM